MGGQGLAPSLAPDWSNKVSALYLFEKSPGLDASGNDLTLTATNGPAVEMAADAPQGASVLLTTQTSSLTSKAAVFQTPSGADFTFGGWFRHSELAAAAAIERFETGAGFRLVHDSVGQAATCLVAGGNMESKVSSPAQSWPIDQWVHVVCRLHGKSLSGHVQGVAVGSAQHDQVDSATADLAVAGSFAGRFDELFYVAGAISDADIRRIWACGVTGAKCACKDSNVLEYDDCGRAQPACDDLPACSSAQPQRLK